MTYPSYGPSPAQQSGPPSFPVSGRSGRETGRLVCRAGHCEEGPEPDLSPSADLFHPALIQHLETNRSTGTAMKCWVILYLGDRQSCCVNSNKFRRLGREGRRLERHLECLRDSWGKNAALLAKYWLKAGACERLPSHHLLSMLSLSTRRSIVCVWPDIPHTHSR